MALHAAAALFAAYMLARNAPAACRALRGADPGGQPRVARAVVPVANVFLAFAILVVAVKGLAGALIRR
jgi:hypothetical protein